MACGGKKFCPRNVMKYASALGLDVKPAKRIGNKLYRFVLTRKDGTEVGYEYGKLLELDLKQMLNSAEVIVDPTKDADA